jgi:hypothetical protein
MEAIRPTTVTTASSRMNTEATPTPAPLAFGASEPSRPQATTKAMTLITVAQIQPRRRCISRTAAAIAGSGAVSAESGDFTGQA